MSAHRQCQSYRRRESFCADGFFQNTGFCSGGAVGCHACGRVDERNVPDCLRENPRHIVLRPPTSATVRGER